MSLIFRVHPTQRPARTRLMANLLSGVAKIVLWFYILVRPFSVVLERCPRLSVCSDGPRKTAPRTLHPSHFAGLPQALTPRPSLTLRTASIPGIGPLKRVSRHRFPKGVVSRMSSENGACHWSGRRFPRVRSYISRGRCRGPPRPARGWDPDYWPRCGRSCGLAPIVPRTCRW